MKKQSGFTLIELMVVMAIIAILATAGLSAYTGYIKKARDTTRIADLNAINTIILGQLSTSGTTPTSITEVKNAITAANNSKMLFDPLVTGGVAKSACLTSAYATTLCQFYYNQCDNGSGFAVAAAFESKSNTALYWDDGFNGTGDSDYFHVGSCSTPCASATGGCTMNGFTALANTD